MSISRRHFLTSTAAAIAAGTLATGRVFGANERIQVGSAGLNGRGWALARAAMARDDTEVVALCDVDKRVLENRAKEVESMTGKRPATYVDYRDMAAADGIDAITVGTPNHWHVLCGIWAMQNGKDVYIEKPISHTIWEGRQLVAARKKYGRVAQHGTQRRSEVPYQRIAERARSGIIGDIYMLRSGVSRFREPFNHPPAEEPPEWLDWTLWQGPAPEKPFSHNYVHYNWHWFWHYGNGETGNNGPHRMDMINWIIDKGLPVKTESSGGIFGYTVDARETPNTQTITHTFADGTLLHFDVRNRYTDPLPFVMAYGDQGYLDGGTFYGKDGKVIPDDKPAPEKADSTQTHMDGFIEAVKKGDPDAVPATVEQGHIAAALCHLGNIAYRLGRTVRFDPETETFPGDDEANALLTRQYREGFEVPELA